MDPRHIPLEYSHRWIFCSIEISKKYYSLFLGCGLLMILSVTGVSFIPVVGGIASPLMTFLFSLGTMRMVHQIITTEKGVFDDFLKYSFDPIVFEKFVPFLVIIGLVNCISVGFALGKFHYALFPSGILANLTTFVCVHAAYMMLIKSELTWDAAIKTTLRGSWMNALTLFVSFIFITLFVTGSLLMCIVGFFLYFVPMTFPLNFLMFSSIYDGLDIDMTLKTWGSKSQEVQTIVAPPDNPT